MRAIREKLLNFINDPYHLAVLLWAILLSCTKKWGVGGSIDPMWYSAISANVAKTGDYFHFVISKYGNNIFDHMPLTYWIAGTGMKFFGVSDFTAKLYPMFCSVLTYFVVYFIGKELKNKKFGMWAVITLGLTFHFVKWSGQLKMEVPLTLYFVLSVFFILKSLKTKNFIFLYPASFFVFLGIMTKGPIIGAIFLALTFWILVTKSWWVFAEKHLYGAFAFLGALLCFPLLPILHFDGQNYYTWFLAGKEACLNPSEGGVAGRLAYLGVLAKGSPLQVLLLFVCLVALIKGKLKDFFEGQGSYFLLVFLVSPALIIPMSFFKVKFGHYLVPTYPFHALIAAIPLYLLFSRIEKISLYVTRFTLLVMVILLVFPIQIGGGREKKNINFVNLIKLDSEITKKSIYLLGDYYSDMKFASEYSFYGDLSTKYANEKDLAVMELKEAWLIVPNSKLPVTVKDQVYSQKDCFLVNDAYCALTGRETLSFSFPFKKLPHEFFGHL